MPRNGSGIYNLPPGTPGVPDTPVESEPYNTFIADLEFDLNYPRPIAAGGTGASNPAEAASNLGALPIAGGVMTGPLTLSGDPVNDLHAVTKQYVDGVEGDLSTGKVNRAGDTMTGPLTLSGDPTDPLHAATKQYAVARAGDTMIGNLLISKSNPGFTLNKEASGQTADLSGIKAGVSRWLIRLGDEAAESGANAGSNFGIYSFDDAGGLIGVPFSINRANGAAAFSSGVSLPGLLSWTGVGTGSYINSNATHFNTVMAGNAYWQYEKATGLNSYILNGVLKAYFSVEGNVLVANTGYKPGGGAWADSSDARIKNVIGYYPRGLDEIAQLRPIYYTFKGNDTPSAPANFRAPHETETREVPVAAPYPNSPHQQAAIDAKQFVGVIAQEVETVFPETVTKRAGYIDGVAVTDLRDLDTGPLIFALINAVKELKARIEVLEAA